MANGRDIETAFVPDAISVESVKIRNAFMRKRRAVPLGDDLFLQLAVEEKRTPHHGDIALLRDGKPTGLTAIGRELLSFAVRLNAMEGTVAPAPETDELSSETISLLCEAALSSWFDASEERMATTLMLVPAVQHDESEVSFVITLTAWRAGEEDRPACLTLALNAQSSQALEWLTTLLSAVPLTEAHESWPVRVTFEFARACLSLAELRQIEIGDAIMLHDRPATMRDLRVRVGEWPKGADSWASDTSVGAWAVFNNRSVILSQSFTKAAGDEMSEETTERDATLDEVEVTLVFEAGRRTMTLNELRGLEPGYTLTLDRRVVDGLDIVVSGRRLGRGKLVQVGDMLGVKLTQLFEDRQPDTNTAPHI